MTPEPTTGDGCPRRAGSIEEEIHLAILRVAALFEHAVGQALKPYDITQTQYNVLRILRGAGPGGLCRHEVAARLIRPVPDVTRLLDRLVDMGLIGRERSIDDRRLVKTEITPQGLDLLARLDEPMVDLHRQRLAHLDPSTLQALAEALVQLRSRE